MRHVAATTAVLSVLTGCAAVAEPTPCPGDAFVFARGRVDGVDRSSACLPPLNIVVAPEGRPEFEIEIGTLAANGWPLAPPFCSLGMFIDDVAPPVTGDTGALTTVEPAVPYYPTQERRTFFVLVVTRDTARGCVAGNVDQVSQTGGAWRVLQGGAFGELVELEARDVTFAPRDGHSFTLDRFRARLQLIPLVRR